MMHVLAKLQASFDAEARAYAELRAQAERLGVDEPPLRVSLALLVALCITIAVGVAALPTAGAFA